jgi:hypothetical protein
MGEGLYSYADDGGRRVEEEERGSVLDCELAHIIYASGMCVYISGTSPRRLYCKPEQLTFGVEATASMGAKMRSSSRLLCLFQQMWCTVGTTGRGGVLWVLDSSF